MMSQYCGDDIYNVSPFPLIHFLCNDFILSLQLAYLTLCLFFKYFFLEVYKFEIIYTVIVGVLLLSDRR